MLSCIIEFIKETDLVESLKGHATYKIRGFSLDQISIDTVVRRGHNVDGLHSLRWPHRSKATLL